MTRLTDVLFCEVVTEQGKKLGRVFDLGCGKEIKSGAKQNPAVAELIYGTRGFLEALWRVNPRGHAGLAGFGQWGPALMALISALCAYAASGLWKGLPSARVLGEGGYETRGLYSGGPGFFDAKAQDVLVQKVRELARKAGRKVPE